MIWIYLFLIAPKLLFDYLVKGKKHPGIKQRIGFSLPAPHHPVIWFHAVSVGEVKSAQPLFQAVRERHPEAYFLVTTTTATGQEEAKRSLREANGFSYLPLDIQWVVKRWVDHFQPKLFVLIESDFWPHLLSELKKSGCRTVLASGKLSERSAKRLRCFSTFARRLFSQFDQICVQNEEHYRRFIPLVPDLTKLHITGNLKLDLKPQPVDLSNPRDYLTISCTHPKEEELILNAIEGIDIPVFLVPRHPERFDEVAEILKRKKISFVRWSDQKSSRFILIDAMGQLPQCYSKSRLAIVCGSYTPIGGHNLLEPCLYGVPVLFGPHIFRQTEFADRLIESGAGLQVPIEKLKDTLISILNDREREEGMRRSAIHLIEGASGSTSRTLQFI